MLKNVPEEPDALGRGAYSAVESLSLLTAGAYNTRSILSRLDSQRVRSPTVLFSNVFNEFELLSLKCFQPSK
jgi:hypothetical protein